MVCILTICIFSELLCGQTSAEQYEIKVSTSLKDGQEVNLSTLSGPDADNPYITLDLEVSVTGNVPDPNNPELFAVAYVSLTGGDGLYLEGSEFNPESKGRLPFKVQVSTRISRSSKLGDQQITVSASAEGVSAVKTVTLKMTREKIGITLTEPKADTYVEPNSIRIEGKISRPIPGVVVNVDIYHKYPELDTDEKRSGIGSGIRLRGKTVTRADGSFAIDSKTPAFAQSFLEGITLKLGGGTWYIHFFTNGLKIFGDDLKKLDYQRPLATMGAAVKTFETEYDGMPPKDVKVPDQYVRKMLVLKPEIKMDIKNGVPYYAPVAGNNVFKRGSGTLTFEITLSGSSLEAVERGFAEVRVNITRPARAGADTNPVRDRVARTVNYIKPFVTLTAQKSGPTKDVPREGAEPWEPETEKEGKWVATWNWRGDYGGGLVNPMADQIPIGIYGVRAELWDMKSNRLLKASTPSTYPISAFMGRVTSNGLVPGSDPLFVVFDFDDGDGWVRAPTVTEFGMAATAKDVTYTLNQYKPAMFVEALRQITFFGADPRDAGLGGGPNPAVDKLGAAHAFTVLVNRNMNYRNSWGYNFMHDAGGIWSGWDTLTLLTPENRGLSVANRWDGQCSDYAAFDLALLRSVGVTSRYVHGTPMNPNTRGEGARHAWVEVFDQRTRQWVNYDPVNGEEGIAAIRTYAGLVGPGSYGLFYPEANGYYVVTQSGPYSNTPLNLVQNYSYIADMQNAVFNPKTPYSRGDSGRFEFDILNAGNLDLTIGQGGVNPRLNITLTYQRPSTTVTRAGVIGGLGFPQTILVPLERTTALSAISARGSLHHSVGFTLPNDVLLLPTISVQVYYPYVNPPNPWPSAAVIASLTVNVPYKGPSTPSIDVDGHSSKLDLPTSSQMVGEGRLFAMNETYVLQNVVVGRTVRSSEKSQIETYSVTGKSFKSFSLNYPFGDVGTRVYIPGLGEVNGNRANMNIETNYVMIYSSLNKGATTYVFSPRITVNSISFTDAGTTISAVQASWIQNVDEDGEKRFRVYTYLSDGATSADGLISQATSAASTEGIRFVSIDASIPRRVLTTDNTVNAVITLQNDASIEQTVKITVEASQPIHYVNASKVVLLRDMQTMTLVAKSSRTVIIPLEIGGNVSSIPWDFIYSVEGGGGGKTSFFISYPVSIALSQTPLLPPTQTGQLNFTITNQADTEIASLTTTIDLSDTGILYGDVTKNIGSMKPKQTVRLSWNIRASSTTDYVRTLVTLSSRNRLISEEAFVIQVANPGAVGLSDLVLKVEPPRNNETVSKDFTLTCRNLGAYPSLNTWLELSTPTGVTAPSRINIGPLDVGAGKNVSGTIRYSLAQDFAVVADVVDSQGLRSSGTIYVDMGKPVYVSQPESESGLVSTASFLWPAVLILPVIGVIVTMKLPKRRFAVRTLAGLIVVGSVFLSFASTSSYSLLSSVIEYTSNFVGLFTYLFSQPAEIVPRTIPIAYLLIIAGFILLIAGGLYSIRKGKTGGVISIIGIAAEVTALSLLYGFSWQLLILSGPGYYVACAGSITAIITGWFTGRKTTAVSTSA